MSLSLRVKGIRTVAGRILDRKQLLDEVMNACVICLCWQGVAVLTRLYRRLDCDPQALAGLFL